MEQFVPAQSVLSFLDAAAGSNCGANAIVVHPTEPSSLIAHALASPLYQAAIDKYASVSVLLTDTEFGKETMSPNVECDVHGVDVNGKAVHYSCIAFHAGHFHAVRKHYCVSEEQFLGSLMRCQPWAISGGRRGVFHKTLDDRYIIKKIREVECEDFLRTAPSYFRHIAGVFHECLPSCLVKILGVYKTTTGRKHKQCVIVMENLFWGRDVFEPPASVAMSTGQPASARASSSPRCQIYDLKGNSGENRRSEAGAGRVRLDQDFQEDFETHPILVWDMSKET